MRALLGLLSIAVPILVALVPGVQSREFSSTVYGTASGGGETPRTPLHVVFHGTWDAADVALVKEFISALPAQGYESQAQLGSVAIDNNHYGDTAVEAIQHQIDIGALPFDRAAALYLLVTSGDVAVTIGGETFCEDYCSKQSSLELHGADGSFGKATFIHAGDVAARCPDRCTFRGARGSAPSPIRHLLRHLGSAITEALPGPDAAPITASQFPQAETSLPATVPKPSASGSAAEQKEVKGNVTAGSTATAKMCAAFPTETFIHVITNGGNSSGVSSGAQADGMPTCAAASVGSMAGRAK
ncbi:unnamed protein product [Closterium sp. Naga37s-1]|nr:unnamed protein product [Closterium sp. Naga37s-1]